MLFGKVKLDYLNFPSFILINSNKFYLKVGIYKKRSSSITLKDNILDVRLSSNLKQKQAQEHLDSLLESISKKLEKKKNLEILTFVDAVNRGYFYLGNVCFNVVFSDLNRFSFKNNTFYLPRNQDLNVLEKKVVFKLCQYFQNYVEKKVIEYNLRTYNFSFGNIVVKYVNSKWGHCTSKNDLLFNLKLLNVPNEVFDYVIAHELSHIIHKNHSKQFWGEVSRFCPNYKKLRKYLKDNFVSLFNDK